MSVYLNVVGFAPPDEAWKKMKAIHDACASAGIDPPEEVEDFFNGEEPDAAGVEVDLRNIATPWEGCFAEGIEVEIAKLPAHIKTLRFYVS